MINYREVRAINNSLMGVYEDDYNAFVAYWVNKIALPKKSDESLTMGSVIDILLTKPEEYENNFIIFRGEAPSAPQMVAFCNKLAALYTPGLPLEGYYPLAYEQAGIKTPKLEGFVERFQSYRAYFDFLINRGDKTVLTQEQASKAGNIVEQLRVNGYTAPIVNATNTDTTEVHNQLEIYGKWKGVPTKGAIDRVLISHAKKIVQPVDFKSSYNVLGFENSYFKYRYYRQGSYYTHLLREWMEERGIGDYKILPFIFIVCSTTGGQHWMYRMSEVDIEMARIGGETKLGSKIKGWEQILDEIVYMQKKRDWAYPYECLVNNGVMELNIFK